MTYDKIILGAGIYGLYAAFQCGRRGEDVVVLERDAEPFSRATYINQARVHMGYHYPRSLSTAEKSAGYFERFVTDFEDCILFSFDQIYATSSRFSWTNAEQFEEFCARASIPCEEVSPDKWFKKGQVDGAFLTKEYTYDAILLKRKLLTQLDQMPGVRILCGSHINTIARVGEQGGSLWRVITEGDVFEAPYILNATYASTNCVCDLGGFKAFPIKYELCEIILCDVSKSLRDVGLTVMDGPFFSIMPFGKTGKHSLTSVTFTPHLTSYDALPTFPCQAHCEKAYCQPGSLGNCDGCVAKPATAWGFMSRLARKYLRDELEFSYDSSLFSMKPILRASEIDDSRPTVIRRHCDDPLFYSVLSGKVNTIYDLDEVL